MRKLFYCILLMLSIVLTACSSGMETGSETNEKTDPAETESSEMIIYDSIVFGDFRILKMVENGRMYYAIEGYLGNAEEVTLPETAPDGLPIEVLGKWAFASCKTIRKLIIPNSYKTIQHWSVERCPNLEEIVIGAGVEKFSAALVFSESNNLSKITVDPQNPVYQSVNNCILSKDGKVLIAGCKSSVIPETVEVIGEDAFYLMETVSEIIIPASVKTISDYAFWGCSRLTTITIPKTVTRIGHAAFHNCPNLTIFCEASEKPSGWENTWDGRNHGEVTDRYPLPTVVWKTE